ncbi:MAM and LDL-receptor class A domain-containing protein 1-like [Pomacea canaliculata]|uniref:MAM and LDL-receptor class A domain-containing protein 1-like n=1 Tax=Pomacea canaliculata TaxID=400727 RepID=UPI000D72EFAC|nr:MAM and LDL-receptor class A domain-containing protein 1-like [Pomacea canaliculata]
MKGSGIGTLSVIMFTTHSNTSTTLWSLSGNQQDQWLFATAPINSHSERYQLRIKGTVGSNYLGDIAIDDINFKPSTCTINPLNANPATQTTTTFSPAASTTSAITSAPTIYDCNFERDYCKWQQAVDDIFNWTRTQGPSGTQSAGPINDHTLGTGQGWYIFIAPSHTSHPDDMARLMSPQITDNTPRCLSFYYHMFGASVNLLNVYMKSSGQSGIGSLIWQRQGTQGASWLHAMVQVTPTVAYQIIFEYVRGTSYSGDIAVDDIAFPTGSCMALVPTTALSFTCDFESTSGQLCGFIQDKTDVFDWTLNSGGTSTAGTGPFADHTYGTLAGHYLYTESSLPQHKNDTARIISKVFDNPDAHQHCLHFFYHMRGSGIGTLNVYTMAQNQLPQLPSPAWTRSADQGNEWKQAEVTIHSHQQFSGGF